MTRVGPKLRAGCMAFRIRWVEECERKRDEAIASRDEARELRGIADRARARESESVRQLDDQVAETERVLTHRGFPHPGGGEHLALAVDNALDTYAARLQMFAEAVASQLDVDVQDRARRHCPVRPDTELLERVQDARNGERRYDALRQRMREGLGLHPMATDDALVRAAHERPFGHTRWQSEVIELVGGGRTDSELLGKLKKLVAPRSADAGTILDAWQQVCRLVDESGIISPASIVDRVAVLVERGQCRHNTPRVGGGKPLICVLQAGHSGAHGDHEGARWSKWGEPDDLAREAYDPAMGGDIEPPPGRDEPEQDWSEKAIERARDYLISLGFRSVVDDHGEDVASMLRATFGPLLDEVERTRAVLAPDVDTDTPLDTLARASIDSNRTLAVAAELRWWVSPDNGLGVDTHGLVPRDRMIARALQLDPAGATPGGTVAPRPDVWAASRTDDGEVPF